MANLRVPFRRPNTGDEQGTNDLARDLLEIERAVNNLGSTPGIVVVDAFGNGDYTSITDAITAIDADPATAAGSQWLILLRSDTNEPGYVDISTYYITIIGLGSAVAATMHPANLNQVSIPNDLTGAVTAINVYFDVGGNISLTNANLHGCQVNSSNDLTITGNIIAATSTLAAGGNIIFQDGTVIQGCSLVATEIHCDNGGSSPCILEGVHLGNGGYIRANRPVRLSGYFTNFLELATNGANGTFNFDLANLSSGNAKLLVSADNCVGTYTCLHTSAVTAKLSVSGSYNKILASARGTITDTGTGNVFP